MKVEINQLNIYSLKTKHVILILVLSFFAFILGLLMNFSAEEKISQNIEAALKSNGRCPMNYKSMSLSYIMPSLNFTDFEISSRCLGGQNPFKLKSITSKLSIPSLSPFGPSFETTLKDQFSQIKIDSAHGFTGSLIKIESSKLAAKTLNPFLGKAKIEGQFTVNSNLLVDYTPSLQELDLQIKSLNFSIPAQNIQNFEVPTLIIGPLSLKAQMKDGKKLNIIELILGNEISPIRANIKGDITLNQKNINLSQIDLIATVKFSQNFLESFSILNLFLDASKQDEDGFYKIKLTGTFNKLGSPEFLK